MLRPPFRKAAGVCGVADAAAPLLGPSLAYYILFPVSFFLSTAWKALAMWRQQRALKATAALVAVAAAVRAGGRAGGCGSLTAVVPHQELECQ